ncbi:VanZ family protein [Thermoactinomyces sp. DSM 45892]|uniref:VanZ family protein n=1 Tax=Thermoactinomyces sp. DSM 45892 TaxID=1882753 RepID=UPI001160112F
MEMGQHISKSIHRILLCMSFAIEILQFLSGTRISDVDDVIFNTTGACFGYSVYRVLRWALAKWIYRKRHIMSGESL